MWLYSHRYINRQWAMFKECNAKSAAWFHKAFGLDSSHSDLIAQVADSESERQALLR